MLDQKDIWGHTAHDYKDYTIRIYKHRIDGPLPWMASVGWPGTIIAWKVCYGRDEHDVIEQAKKMIDREMKT